MSRVLPILFNTEMVRAILKDRKTVTRRLVKPQPILDGFFWKIGGAAWSNNISSLHPMPFHSLYNRMPCHTGDILYVRETWRVGAWDIHNQMIAFDYKDGTFGELVHIRDRILFERLVDQSREEARKSKCKYSGVDFIWRKGESPCRWRPSIHMPKEAARIWLKVTDVRVERLQEINELGGRREGFVNDICLEDGTGKSAVKHFADLWDSTIKKADIDKYGWKADPWVWVIEFEMCEKPEGSSK